MVKIYMCTSWVYVFFYAWLFGFWGGWVGHQKSEHCSDFENTYTKMDGPLVRLIILIGFITD